MQMGDSHEITMTCSSLPKGINFGNDFLPTSIVISEVAMSLPTFGIKFKALTPDVGLTYQDLKLKISKGDVTKSYNLTQTRVTSESMSGYLFESDKVFTRRSAYLKGDVHEIIKSFGLRDGIEGFNVIKQEDTFLQMQETDVECAVRLLNMCSKEMVWVFEHNKIKLFSPEPSSFQTKFNTTLMSVSYDRTRSSKTNYTELTGSADRRNVHFGRQSTCIPRLSDYPQEAVYSTVIKRKFRDDWRNCSLQLNFNMDPNFEIGSTINLPQYGGKKVKSYVVFGKVITLERVNATYTYTLVNQSGWGVDNE